MVIQPASKEAREVEEAVAVLLDMAGAPRTAPFEPRSMKELRQVRVESIRRGREVVLRWDADGQLHGLLEIDDAAMAVYRSHAARIRYPSDPLSEAISLTKVAGVPGVGVRFVAMKELREMVEKAAENPPPLGVPVYVPRRK